MWSAASVTHGAEYGCTSSGEPQLSSNCPNPWPNPPRELTLEGEFRTTGLAETAPVRNPLTLKTSARVVMSSGMPRSCTAWSSRALLEKTLGSREVSKLFTDGKVTDAALTACSKRTLLAARSSRKGEVGR